MAGSTEWRTPPAFFRQLDIEFHFDVDAAASAGNALVGTWSPECRNPGGRFYTAETDGTKTEHYGRGDRVWCNPPYSPAPLVSRFVETASKTSRERAALWVMLLNSTCCDTRWFHRFIWDAELNRPRDRVELRLLPGRLNFLKPDGTPAGQPRHGNMLVIFHPADWTRDAK